MNNKEKDIGANLKLQAESMFKILDDEILKINSQFEELQNNIKEIEAKIRILSEKE